MNLLKYLVKLDLRKLFYENGNKLSIFPLLTTNV